MKMELSEKRYALLLAAKDSEYVKKVHGGYLNVFVDAFGSEGEKWDLFRVVEGEFPEIEELHKYQGFVISGSPHDAYANESWILHLCFLLQTLFAMQKKILGICFGHQVLCRALGGKVAKSYSGWDIGVRKVSLNEDFYSYGEIPPTISIIECHQDEVWEVPVGAHVLAYSEKTGVEMFTFGECILGIQGHPEYTNDILDSACFRTLISAQKHLFLKPLDTTFLKNKCFWSTTRVCKRVHNLIDRLITNNSINREFGEGAKLQLIEAEPDRKIWERICKCFLKGEWSIQLPAYFFF